MSSFEVESPILCSPFAEPGEHWWIEEGTVPDRRFGRRPAGYWYRDPKAPEPEAGFTRGEDPGSGLLRSTRGSLSALFVKIRGQVFFVPPVCPHRICVTGS